MQQYAVTLAGQLGRKASYKQLGVPLPEQRLSDMSEEQVGQLFALFREAQAGGGQRSEGREQGGGERGEGVGEQGGGERGEGGVGARKRGTVDKVEETKREKGRTEQPAVKR